MSDDGRSTPSSLKGRLADVYVPALVEGSVEALSRRLGNRATIDDPVHGRASSLASIDPLLTKTSSLFRGGTYVHASSTSGVDRDAAEGVLTLTDGSAMPILVMAERRRLREIELRIYYAPPKAKATATPSPARGRAPLTSVTGSRELPAVPHLVAHVVDAMKKGAIERVLSAFEESSTIVDPRGKAHAKRDGGMASFLAEIGGGDIVAGGTADDGRTCCLEASLARAGRELSAAAFTFERGDSGLFRELRLYYDV